MVVGNNDSMTTKNADESLAILMAMAMQRYDRPMEHIQVSNKTHKTLTKHNF